MRVYALYMLIAFLAVYAWKDWFKSLCGLILLMAVLNHEDMPKNIMGIQGLNPWNVLFGMIVLAWLAARRQEGLRWDMPRYVSVLLLLYLGIILVGFVRAVFDRAHLGGYPLKSLVSEELINTVKWVLPGVLLFDGCRTRRRLRLALICILAMYVVLSVQVINRMPFASALGGGGDRIQHMRLKTCRSIGYSAVNLSVILAGGFWGILAAVPLIRRKRSKVLVVCAAGIAAFGQVLTGGRAGYLAWVGIGLVLCLLRWRRYLLFAPVLPIVLYFAFPGAAARALTGFDEIAIDGSAEVNMSMVTSERVDSWKHVIERIGEAPVFGYGRLAATRTGLVEATEGDLPHPHNTYLEWLLDNGVLGLIPVAAFYVAVILIAGRVFTRENDPLYVAIGGLALSLVLAQLIAGIGSQHFYPTQSTVGTWAAIFLLLRVSLEREKLRARMRGGIPGNGTLQSRQSRVPAFSEV